MEKKIKLETEIRNLKSEIKKLRILCEGSGVPLLIVYLPDLAIGDMKTKQPRRLNKKQILWLIEKGKEFEKMISQ